MIPYEDDHLAKAWQYLIAFPFLRGNPVGYLSRAFELTRSFLYKWTVNWRFVGEATFLSREFSIALSVCGLSCFLLFAHTRWTRPSSLSVVDILRTLFNPLSSEVQQQIAHRVTPRFILTSILSSMVIGLLFARTLHYQFYTYIVWSSPFLLWRSGLDPIFIYLVWAAQEWAWNVYPSTNTSSMVVVGCLTVQVIGIWWGTKDDLAEKTTKAVEENPGSSHKTSNGNTRP